MAFGILFLVLALMVLGVVRQANAESCWDHYQVLNEPRAAANVPQYEAFAYLVGGVLHSRYTSCRDEYLGLILEQGAMAAVSNFKCDFDAEQWEMKIDPVDMQGLGYVEAKAATLLKGIHGRAFASRLGKEVFVCYACRFSLDGYFDDEIHKFTANGNAPTTVTRVRPLNSRRRGTTMVTFRGLLWFFGGLEDVTPPRMVSHVDRYNVTTETSEQYADVMDVFTGYCDCSTSTTHDSILLYNCLNCTTQDFVPSVFTFNVTDGPEGSWAISPTLIPPGSGMEMQIGASNGMRLGRFAVSVWPNGFDSPGVQMYDPVMGTSFFYPIEHAYPVNNPGFTTVGSNAYMFGGANIDGAATGDGHPVTFPGESRSSQQPPAEGSTSGYVIESLTVRSVRLVPNTAVYYEMSPKVPPNSTIHLKNTAECQSPTEKLTLSYDPDCSPEDFVDLDNIVQCAPGALNFSMSKVREGATKLWICRTEGICSPYNDVPCHAEIYDNGTNAQSDCRWEGCCWSASGKCLGTRNVVTHDDVREAYWVAVQIEPIIVDRPIVPQPQPTFVQGKWFKLILGLGAALVLYFVILCLWRRGSHDNGSTGNSTLDSLFSNKDNNSFGVFGKKYQVVKRIGQGGYGTVFHAIRRADKVDVAMKYIPCNQPKARDAAINEFDLAQRLKHPNKMDCLDLVVHWGEEGSSDSSKRTESKRKVTIKTPSSLSTSGDGDSSNTGSKQGSKGSKNSKNEPLLENVNKFVCLVMPMYPLGDLSQYCKRHMEEHAGRPIGLNMVLSIAKQLADVMHFLHSLDPPIVHRDLKPENVLVTDENCDRVVVSDFGMAHYQPQTYMTTRAGTLHYAAPETWKKQYTASVDIWSLGCVFYAIATGNITMETTRVMFSDCEDENFAQEITHDLVTKNQYPPEFAQLVLGMLDPEPDTRLTSKQVFDRTKKLFNSNVMKRQNRDRDRDSTRIQEE